jgi:transposase
MPELAQLVSAYSRPKTWEQKEAAPSRDRPEIRGKPWVQTSPSLPQKGTFVMRFIGADLHKKTITFCVVELVQGKTKIVERQRVFCSETRKIQKLISKHAPCQLVVETTIGYEWFAELSEPLVNRLALAHAGKMRIIAESTRKTDKIDAFVLAEFLAKDMIPEAWFPKPRTRQHRTLVRRRHKIQSRITSVKNTMRGILTRYNRDQQDIFTRHGWDIAKTFDLLQEDRWVLDDLWDELQEHRCRLRAINLRLKEFAEAAPPLEAEARAVLATMPGVGPVTTETILAELGDWRRFDNGDSVVSYAGLDPGVRSSDAKRHDLKLTKAGSPLLRWIMIQLAHRLKQTTVRWRRVFDQIRRRSGNKKATCAVARRILLVIYAMLRDGQAYRHPAIAA